MNIKLLDCTLRDGGYVNNWEFGSDNIQWIISKLQKSNIDIIEIGYIRDYEKDSIDKTVFSSTLATNRILKAESFEKNASSLISAMIDFGDCSIEQISNQNETNIDILRVTFRKKHIDEALEYCKKIKAKGYKIFLQPVSITSYSDKEMLDLIEKINKIKPIALSIVDSYGLMHEEKVIRYFYLMDNNLLPEIGIAYHSHNNFQLAYSNSIKLLNMHSKRDLYIDASLYGMGKTAGNCNLELLAMYLNHNFNKNYNLNEILDIIDVQILKLSDKYKWGYQIPYFISASNDCHPNYVNYLMEKNMITIKEINQIVNKIPKENLLVFNRDLIEKLYFDFESKQVDDSNPVAKLKNILSEKEILLLGSGNSISKESDKINKYIETKQDNIVVISLNHINKYVEQDFIFVSNAKRFEQFYLQLNNLNNAQLILTSNIDNQGKDIDFILNWGNLSSDKTIVGTSALYLLLNLLKNIGIKKLTLAGFDGFSKYASNYYDKNFEFRNVPNNYEEVTDAIIKELKYFEQYFDITFLTKSKYLVNDRKVINV